MTSITDFKSLDEIREYVNGAYSSLREPGPGYRNLPLGVAVPDGLILRAIELAGPVGISTAELKRAIPVGEGRFEMALFRVRDSKMADRRKESRPDKRGAVREQIVWYPST